MSFAAILALAASWSTLISTAPAATSASKNSLILLAVVRPMAVWPVAAAAVAVNGPRPLTKNLPPCAIAVARLALAVNPVPSVIALTWSAVVVIVYPVAEPRVSKRAAVATPVSALVVCVLYKFWLDAERALAGAYEVVGARASELRRASGPH